MLAASFRASDSLYYAIPFVQDGEELYYNEKGNSLEGAFLKARWIFTGFLPALPTAVSIRY